MHLRNHTFYDFVAALWHGHGNSRDGRHIFEADGKAVAKQIDI
jgi:hypothetical protein